MLQNADTDKIKAKYEDGVLTVRGVIHAWSYFAGLAPTVQMCKQNVVALSTFQSPLFATSQITLPKKEAAKGTQGKPVPVE